MKALLLAPMGSVHRRFNQANMDALQSMGTEVHLVANFNVGEGTEKQNQEYAQTCSDKGIVVHSIPFERHSLRKNLSKVRFLRELLNQEKFDLVHAHTETGGLLLRLAGKSDSKTKFFYTPHGMSFYKGSSLKSQLIYRPIEKWICKAMDCNIAINSEEYEVLKGWNKETAARIHGTGIDLGHIQRVERSREEIRQELKLPQEAKVILSVGELDQNKNHQMVIKALAQMKDNNAYYVICGIGPEKENLLQLAKDCGLEDRVILAGYRKDIPDMIHASDIFAFPSFHEGISVALMEAMAGGLPVVCSEIRGNVDLIEDGKNGFLCQPDQLEEWVVGLRKLTQEPCELEGWREFNERVLEKYQRKAVTETLRDLYSRNF